MKFGPACGGRAGPGVLAAVVCAALWWPGALRAEEVIHYQDWLRLKGPTSLLQLPALQRVVDQFEAADDSVVIVRYPGGDEGNAWALQLRDWLVALGITSDEIRLEPGSGVPQGIVIRAEAGGAP